MLNRLNNYLNDDEFKVVIYDNKIYINNYTEIKLLDIKKVIININNKIIVINGNNLEVKKLLDKEILIEGSIKSLEEIYE